MFQVAGGRYPFVVRCKHCGEHIQAPVETMPSSWVATKCPLCGEYRRYLPTEIFQGHLSWRLMKKPVQSAGVRRV